MSRGIEITPRARTAPPSPPPPPPSDLPPSSPTEGNELAEFVKWMKRREPYKVDNFE